LKLFWELGEWDEREQWRVNSSMIYLIQCKNLYKCYNVLLPSTAIKKKSVLLFSSFG
jgi:hypothetical protein